jgi:hypothetical protein
MRHHEKALQIKPLSEIFAVNKMPGHLFFKTESDGKYKGSKLSFTDAKRMVEVFFAKI